MRLTWKTFDIVPSTVPTVMVAQCPPRLMLPPAATARFVFDGIAGGGQQASGRIALPVAV